MSDYIDIGSLLSFSGFSAWCRDNPMSILAILILTVFQILFIVCMILVWLVCFDGYAWVQQNLLSVDVDSDTIRKAVQRARMKQGRVEQSSMADEKEDKKQR